MSTASQRRKARREHLQRPFAEKVAEVAKELAAKHPRRPARVEGLAFAERIDKIPAVEYYLRRDRPYPPESVQLRRCYDAEAEYLPREIVIPIRDPIARSFFGRIQTLRFVFREYVVSAGETRVRWTIPELVDSTSPEHAKRAEYSARKAVSAVLAARDTWAYRAPPDMMARALDEAANALIEWMGETDPSHDFEKRNEEAREAIRRST